jgi:hypothetical protein
MEDITITILHDAIRQLRLKRHTAYVKPTKATKLAATKAELYLYSLLPNEVKQTKLYD